MSYGKVVRISDKTIGMLEKLRQGFETPDSCISRVLSNHIENNNSKVAKVRVTQIIDDNGTVYSFE